MTLNEFKSLSTKAQEIAAMDGSFLTDRREGPETIALYRVGDFYVEIIYNRATNAITGFSAFDSLQGLAPYFEHSAYKPNV